MHWAAVSCVEFAHDGTTSRWAWPWERHAVRCCSENGGNCETTLSCNNDETAFLNYHEAVAHCEGEGRRLCTKEEFDNRVCCDSGDCDNYHSWTSNTQFATTGNSKKDYFFSLHISLGEFLFEGKVIIFVYSRPPQGTVT